jgi:hypothetical protein
MEIGTLIFTKPQRAITDTRRAEERGFAQAWFPDSHMIWGDAYVCMALAAANTSKIKLATGISVASNRIPPVTVHAIATINQLAPGRVTLGYGTGHTGRRVMGLPPVRFDDFREQVRVIRDLLQRGEAIYRTEGLSRTIRYLHRDLRFVNLDDRIPLYVAANGPRMLGVAGEFGDGIIVDELVEPVKWGIEHELIEAGPFEAAQMLDDLITGRNQRGRSNSCGRNEFKLALRHEGAMPHMKLKVARIGSTKIFQVTRVFFINGTRVSGKRTRLRVAGGNGMQTGDHPWADHPADAWRIDRLARTLDAEMG